jgi:predicted transcriptional regulator
MAGEVKWIRLVGNPLDLEKINRIGEMAFGDELLVFWYKLLSVTACRLSINECAFLDKLPYTDETLSKIFRMNEATIERALSVFCNLGMIEIVTETTPD